MEVPLKMMRLQVQKRIVFFGQMLT